MAAISIDFEWVRGFKYECVLGKSKADAVIRQVGKGSERFRPLDHFPKLYLEFAKLDGSAEACLGFAKKCGLLTIPDRSRRPFSAPPRAEEPLSMWADKLKTINVLKRTIPTAVQTANSRRVQAKITSVDIALLSGKPDAEPTLLLQPRTLFDAMLIQMAQSFARGNSPQACAQCGDEFEVGAEGKRSFTKFCSNRCRMQHHYYARRAGK